MIKAVGNITGHIRSVQSIKGKINNATVKIYPELEDLEVIPSGVEQNFKSNMYGYDNVKVKAVESEEITITPTTTDQVKEGMYKKVTVAGDSNLIAENIKEGTSIFGVEGSAKTTNLKITDASYLFYNGARTDYIEEYLNLLDNITSMRDMFYGCSKLTSIDLSNFDTSNVTDMQEVFNNCSSLTSLDLSNFDTSNVTSMRYMFGSCSKLTEIDLSSFDMNKVNAVYSMFTSCSNITTLMSFKNLGKGYTQKTSNYSNYILALSRCTKLSYESLIDLITNGLYDLNLTYDVANGGTLYTQQLLLGSTNMAKLTSEEIAIATNKGWTVS